MKTLRKRLTIKLSGRPKLSFVTLLVPLLFSLTFASLGVYLLWPSHAATPTSSSSGTAPPVPWPNLEHKAGAYAIQDKNQVGLAASLGINLVTAAPYYYYNDQTWQSIKPLLSEYDKYGIKYIETSPAQILYKHYLAACNGGKFDPNSTCSLNPAQEQALLVDLDGYLDRAKNDPNIVAYYILDDDPGNVASTLKAMRAEIYKKQGSSPRPVLCAFGGVISYKVHPTDPNFVNDFGYIDQEVKNYSPQACEGVMLYPYAGLRANIQNVSDASFDWSMSQVLPYEVGKFKERGWNPNRDLFIGVPQALGGGNYFTPSAASLSRQVLAYCQAGANAVVAFSWMHIADTPGTSYVGLTNSESFRSGYADGINRCQAGPWKPPAPPPVASSPSPTQGKVPGSSHSTTSGLPATTNTGVSNVPANQAVSPSTVKGGRNSTIATNKSLGSRPVYILGALLLPAPLLILFVLISWSFHLHRTSRPLIPRTDASTPSNTGHEHLLPPSANLSVVNSHGPPPGTVIQPDKKPSYRAW